MFQKKAKPVVQPRFSEFLDVFRSQDTIDAREVKAAAAKKKQNAETAKGFQYLLANWSKKPVSVNVANSMVTVGGRNFSVERDEDRLADTLDITARSVDGQVLIGIVRVPAVMFEEPLYSTTIIDRSKGIELYLRDNVSTFDTVPSVHGAAERLLKQMTAGL